MKVLLYILILALVLVAPVNRLDIAKLQPVEAVAMQMVEDRITLITDTGDRGAGKTVSEALQDLKEKASSIIYLDTADFLLISHNARQYTGQIKQYLKSSVKVGSYNGTDVKEEAKYLDVHTDRAKPSG